MNAASATIPLPSGFTPLLDTVRAQLGDSLGALLLFGSCLSAQTRQPDSVPDMLAFVGNLDTALRQLGCGPVTRALAGWLPPLTLALRASSPTGAGRPLAKLNLIELAVAQQAVHELPDLYLAGRLSKPTAWLWAGDPAHRTAVEALLHSAQAAVAELTLRGLDGRTGGYTLPQVVHLYIGQSYLAEPRPEGEEKWRALQASFPTYYDEHIRPLLLARAPKLGLRPTARCLTPPQESPEMPPGEYTALLDQRSPAQRRADHKARAQLLRRSRFRTVARWPKMALVYRGWLTYLVGKLQRVGRQRRAAQPGADR